MPVAGVIAEFDPFHLGHQYLFEALRQQLGQETPVVVVLSGHFTQRGDAAICPPTARAEMALKGGADLVLELPLPFATASSETFAKGAVQTLLATGVVDTLCFGSECASVDTLCTLARTAQSPAFQAAVRERSASGLPYAAARQQALEQLLRADQVPTGANDLLGSEYLRFWPEDKAVLAIRRTGGEHNGAGSASQVRALLRGENWAEAEKLLPTASWEILQRQRQNGLCPASLSFAQQAVLYRMRTMTEEELAAIPDCTEGLEHRLIAAAQQASTLEELYGLAKSKRYAHARLRRIVLRAFLGISSLPDSPAYLRVLGANDRGLALLRQMKETATLPLVTKPAHGKRLSELAKSQYLADYRAQSLWSLCLARSQPADLIWRAGPVILPSNAAAAESD
jgi:predicted nucleotidyltransferase